MITFLERCQFYMFIFYLVIQVLAALADPLGYQS
jgi:hypothetical protein